MKIFYRITNGNHQLSSTAREQINPGPSHTPLHFEGDRRFRSRSPLGRQSTTSSTNGLNQQDIGSSTYRNAWNIGASGGNNSVGREGIDLGWFDDADIQNIGNDLNEEEELLREDVEYIVHEDIVANLANHM